MIVEVPKETNESGDIGALGWVARGLNNAYACHH